MIRAAEASYRAEVSRAKSLVFSPAAKGAGLGSSGHSERVGIARRLKRPGTPTLKFMAQSLRKTPRIGKAGAGLGPVELKPAVCLPPGPSALAFTVQKLPALLFHLRLASPRSFLLPRRPTISNDLNSEPFLLTLPISRRSGPRHPVTAARFCKDVPGVLGIISQLAAQALDHRAHRPQIAVIAYPPQSS